MPQEKPGQTEPIKANLPPGQTSSTDADISAKPQDMLKPSLLRAIFKTQPLFWHEQVMPKEQVGDGARLTDDKRLQFDSQTIDQDKQEMVIDFLRHVENGTWKNSPYSWMFAEEGDDFVIQLANQLRLDHRDAIEDFLQHVDKNTLGESHYTWLFKDEKPEAIQRFVAALRASLREKELEAKKLTRGEMSDKLRAAAESMRDVAKRERIRKAMKTQIKRVPIDAFMGIDRDGEMVVLKYDPNDPYNENNEVDFLYISNEFGEPELLITSKKSDVKIGAVVFTKDDDLEPKNKFEFSYNGKNEVKEGGRDFTHHEIEILGQGFSPSAPIFTKVRVFTEPIDLRKEMDELWEDDQQRAKAQARKPQGAKPSTYPGTPPSVSPTPAWQQPTSYVNISSSRSSTSS